MKPASAHSGKSEEDLSFLKQPVVIIVTVVRFLSAVYILYAPYPGLLLSILLDILDAQVLIHIARIKRSQYHVWDKNVDWLCYITELWVASMYGLFLPFFLLLFYRFVGQYMYMKFKNTLFFVLYPNLYEIAFLWLVMTHPDIGPVTALSYREWVLLGLLMASKLIHEFLLHYVWTKLALPHFEEQQVSAYHWLRRRFIRQR
jgi:hypothetical protein